MSYKHLTVEERYQIQAYKEASLSKSEIAKKLNEFGVTYIEGGWPNATNPIDVEFFKEIKSI